jgi:hypothetical protein
VSKVPISITAFDAEDDRHDRCQGSEPLAASPGVVLTNTQTWPRSPTSDPRRRRERRADDGHVSGRYPFNTIGNNTNIGVLSLCRSCSISSATKSGAVRKALCSVRPRRVGHSFDSEGSSLTEFTRYARPRQHYCARRSGYDVGYAMGGPIKEDKSVSGSARGIGRTAAGSITSRR